MNQNSRLYRFTSTIIAVAMLLQLISPLFILPTAVSAAPVAQSTTSTMAEQTAVSTNAPPSPLLISQQQSTYQADGLVAVTYTVHNQLSPTVRPATTTTDTITDTIAAIGAVDFAADANSVRDVQLVLQPTNPQTSFQSASLPVDTDDNAIVINVGDLPPLGETAVVITLTAPSSAADFVELDSGANGYGNWRGRAISATAAPIAIAPDGFDQWLVCTVDANCDDSFVQEQTAVLLNDPAAIFAFVRGLGYESYLGSLRGARGTLWSEAGNATDQASLLVALLRASGIPAAYRQGTLDYADAQTLIASMFPPVIAPSGHIPAGTPTADPVNDPALIAEAQAHTWVEAYLPGSGWTTFDPSFPAAQMGDLFGTAIGGQIAELSDDVRHQVTVALEVEKYSQFPVGSTNLYTIHPLTATFNIVELVGEPLVFAHIVDTYNPGGFVFSTVEHTYTPYFLVGEEAREVAGDPFTELLSSFPFGQDFAVGEWLDFTLTAPDGSSETYRRELFDDIGYAVRTGGGLIDNIERDGTARLSIMSSWATLFTPSAVPPAAINSAYQEMVALTADGIVAHEAAAQMVDTDNPTAEEAEAAKQAVTTFSAVGRLAQRLHLLKYAAASSQSHDYVADIMLVKAYPDSPRLFMTGWERNDIAETDDISFDLMRNHVRSIAYPGQTDGGAGGFLFWRALLDMSIEHEILAEIAPAPLTSVSEVFTKAIADGVPFERITFGGLDYLATMPISDQAKARITTALIENNDLFVLVPAEMILLDGATEPTIGWLTVDNESEQVVDMMEDGQHGAIGYAVLAKFSKKAGSLIGGFSAGFFTHTMGFWAGFFEQMPLDGKYIGQVIANAKDAAAEMGKQAEMACKRIGDKKWCKRGAAIGNVAGAAAVGRADPPLQELLFVLPFDEPETNAETAVSITRPATLSGNVSANVGTGMTAVYGTADHSWTSAAQNSFVFDELTAVSADLFVDGALVDSGAMTVVSATATLDNTPTTIDGTADGSIALHAAALTDLGAGGAFESYDFDLNAGNYTLALDGEIVTVNDNDYSGDVELVVSGTAVLHGTGATAAPNFAANATITPANGGVMVADGSGSLTVGGTTVSPENGFALGNANSALTIAPAGASDSLNYNGAADFFAMTLSADSSTVPADTVAAFTADIAANFGDTYTMTVIAPDGWDVTADASGNITAQPPVGAAAGDYTVLATAQSATHPDLFVSAVHLVSVTAVDGISVTVAPDPLYTVPWGADHDVINFVPTLGQVQIPDAAFAATIQNQSSIARTFDVSVSGLPAGWAIFGAEEGNTTLQLSLEAGQRVDLGLYVLPTTAVLPTAGDAYPFTITATATDDGAVTATDNETFTMPAIAYPALAIDPANIYTAENSEVAFDLTVTNIGNTAGSFDLVSSVPVAGWANSTLQSPITLAVNESATQIVTTTVGTGKSGVDHPVSIGAAVPTMPYTPTTAVNIYLVSPLTEPLFGAANSCTMNSAALAAALEALAYAVTALESSCDAGNCDLVQRDAAVDAANSAAQYARVASRDVSYAALETIAADMATHTTAVDLDADMEALGTAVGTLSTELCDLEGHQPIARFTPYVDAILLGDSSSIALDVTNSGTLSTTYAITVTGLPDGDQFFNETIAAGAMVSLPINSTPAVLGAFDVEATVTAVGDYTLTPETTAVSRLNVVDKFLQVTQVIADPAFVETGVSSTTISVEIANIAGVAWPANAKTAVFAPDNSMVFTQDTPITALAGTPRWYELATVDSSGWAEGVYTVTVELLDDGGALIPDGNGYGYFSVGQAIVASHAVQPDLVALGTVTVTTIVTTELTAGTSVSSPLAPLSESAIGDRGSSYPSAFLATLPAMDGDSLIDGLPLADLYTEYQEQLTINSEQLTINGSQPITRALTPIDEAVEEIVVVERVVTEDVTTVEASPLSILNSQLSINSVFTRTEESDPAVVYTGTWSVGSLDRASGGGYYRADTAGETAVFTFNGDWLNIGFLGSRYSGQADVTIDGISQGVIDLYRHDETAISYVYDGLINSTHTVTVTALGTQNPYANSDYVQLDYFDAWDSSSLPDGTFEQNDQRVIVSTGWVTQTDSIASGGNYIRDGVGTVWFPFTGDSFSYHAIDRSGINHTQLSVDGRFLTNLNTTNFDTITHTYSYDGFGAGAHILQVSTYRGTSDVDAFTTPAIAPIDSPELTGSYIRYEEDNHNWLYNGVPYTQTAQSWTRRNYFAGTISSDGQAMFSNVGGETAVITVNGEWINIGFAANSNSGSADIYLDGAYQRTIDLYRHHDSVTSAFFPALSAGDHTISVTVVGDGYVWIDYVDVWDGTALPDGTYETFPGQFYLSGGWSRSNNASAINGNYLRTTGGTAWFPFTGDSVSYRAFAYSSADNARLYIDNQFMGTLDLFNSDIVSRTFSFDGLGAGAHLLRLEDHYGTATVEDFSAPAISPIYTPPVPSGIIRYEEDDPALRYNGVPLTQTVTSWDDATYAQYASEGYYADSSTMGDSVSLEFNGTWVGVGFLTWRTRGMADIYLDGNLVDTVDLFTHKLDTKSVYYNDLTNSPHTISVTVRGESHPNAVGTEIAIDYIDIWDGTSEADGTFEETDRDRIIYSYGWAEWSEAEASGGGYADTGTAANVTAWFPFTGDSVSYQAWARRNTHLMEIKIDGVPVASNGQTHFDIFADVPISRTFSFDGLGAGPHILEINQYRDDLTLDNFSAPGIAPFYTPPITPTGIVRYEEDHPALLYNGYPLEQSPYCFYCWWTLVDAGSSGNAIAQSREVGDWVELTFDGSWAGVGFATGTYGGVAEIFIDGTSMMTVSLTGPQDVTSVYFSDLITGTHTISASLVSGNIYFDYFDVWDGTEMADGWFDADLDQHNGPYYYSDLNSWYTLLPTDLFAERIQYAYDEDVLDRGSVSSNTHLWFGFTGNDLEFLPFEKAGDTVEVFIDGISQGVLDLTAEYSNQPLAVYYNDLGEGPHMVHLDATDGPRIDAFQVNPPAFLPYTPIVEWMDAAPTDVYTTTFANAGLLSSAAIGDLDGDGLVEIVSPSSNGQLYVYRGDGLDAGGGSPIIWQTDLVGAAAEPSLADLDGDGKAEIIVMGTDGTAAFHHDGSVYWFTDTIKSQVENAGWGGSSIGNIDLEPSPEIVLTAYNDALYVLDHDGTLLFSEPTGASFPAVPTLADVTGDGFLDIIFAADKTITAYDAFNGYNIAWTRTHTYTGFYGDAFGSPAVADIDGKQPGGDDGVEVIINWGSYVDVLDADGTLLWNYYMGSDSYRRPSPVTIADVDGDNEIEILTASALQSGFFILHHKLVALNADGTVLWSNEMGDTTASASGVATQDLDGDGVWEVVWNGLNEGFSILNGSTGERLFNEEFTESGTFVDYPVMGDVDGDGYAEVVTGGRNGLFVIGFDEVWGDSRPVWNQHNYHVTNINDDWSVPVNEPNSWDIHNTYRTQTPDRNPTPVYQINVTYTAGIDNITVLTPTGSISMTGTPPVYNWNYHQEWYQPVVTTTFDSVLTDMQAGETRLVAEGTQIAYRLPSGYNSLMLPPLYVTAPHIVAIAPAAETVWAGLTAVYTLTLTNPAANADNYALSISGVPSDWVDAPANVPIAADTVMSVPITVTVPPDAAIDILPVIVDVTNDGGGTDSAIAYLSIVNALQIGLDPTVQSAYVGVPVSYTLTISNVDGILHTYTLTATGLADVSMPASIDVLGGGQESVTIQATATAAGERPFTIQATADNGIGKSVDGVVEGLAVGVELALAPDPVVAGAGSTAVFTLTVSNTSDTVETFDLIPSVPAGWSAELMANGTAVNSVTLTPDIFNTAEFLLMVTTDAAAVAGNYEVEVTATPQNAPDATASISSTVDVLPLGVEIEIVSGPTAVDPLGSATWQVEVTNNGTSADTFDLQLAGVFALTAQFDTNVVTLAAAQSQTVQATTNNLTFLMPETFPLVVAATSQTDGRIQHQDRLDVSVNQFEAVEIAWQPASQTVTDTLTAGFTLIISNTGNVATTYNLNMNTLTTMNNAIPNTITIPAHGAVILPVAVTASGIGTHPIEATVSSESGLVSGVETAVLIVNSIEGVEIMWQPTSQTVTATLSAEFTLLISNTGNAETTYTIDLNTLMTVDNTIPGTVSVQAHSTVSLPVTVVASGIGTHPIEATVSSESGVVSDIETAVLTVGSFEGVEIMWQPPSQTVTATLSAEFTLLISNTGNAETTYTIDLNTLMTVDNAVPATVSVPAHSAASLPVTVVASGIGTHPIEATVSSESGVVSDVETAVLIVDSIEGVEIMWQPTSQTVTDTLSAEFTLLISNTGNVETTYTIDLSTLMTVDNAVPGTVSVPAHSAVSLPVTVVASGIGTHPIEATVSSESGVVSDVETAVLIVADNRIITYLPIILK